MSRTLEGLQHLSRVFSADREGFAKAMHPGGAMLLEGLHSKGYVNHQNGRYAVNDAGRRLIRAEQAPSDD